MLTWARPRTEPGIIGDIDQPAGAGLSGINYGMRKNHFIADQGRDGRRRWRIQNMGMISGTKTGTHRELLDADTVKDAGEGQIFPKRHQMKFVIDLRLRAAWAKQVKAIVGGGATRIMQYAVGPGYKRLAPPCEKRDPVQRGGGARHGKAGRGFRPNNMGGQFPAAGRD